MGVTRRMRVFDDPSLQIWFVVAGFGAAVIAVGIAAMLIQFAVSIWRRDQLRDATGDPWEGRTLEWATSSPPPDYNRSEEHTSELPSLMRTSYAVFGLQKKNHITNSTQ